MNQKHPLIKGAAILTLAGMCSRVIGFFYRIFLSHTIGAEGVGIYQLIFPVYTLSLSLTTAGIQTAISRFVSSKMAVQDKKGAKDILISGMLVSFLLSVAVSLALFLHVDFIAASLLFEPRCTPLLKILCFALPLSSIHSCIIGYYMGLKETKVPAVSQLFEQTVRVGSSFLIYQILLEKGLSPSPVLAVWGMLCAEAAAVLYTATKVIFYHHAVSLHQKHPFPFACIPGLLTFALPLTLNRVLINLLQSVEAVCIPLRLQVHGLSTADALSTYGTLTGMALPLVLFPSAVTTALAAVLLPAVSEAQASKNSAAIAKLAQKTIKSCLGLGACCTTFFLLTGRLCGALLFNNAEAGTFILILAWLCPFLYLNTTLGSILNGLGKTLSVFFSNMASLLIRIFFIWFAVPAFGIQGYLWGLLLAQLLQSALMLLQYQKVSLYMT